MRSAVAPLGFDSRAQAYNHPSPACSKWLETTWSDQTFTKGEAAATWQVPIGPLPWNLVPRCSNVALLLYGLREPGFLKGRCHSWWLSPGGGLSAGQPPATCHLHHGRAGPLLQSDTGALGPPARPVHARLYRAVSPGRELVSTVCLLPSLIKISQTACGWNLPGYSLSCVTLGKSHHPFLYKGESQDPQHMVEINWLNIQKA